MRSCLGTTAWSSFVSRHHVSSLMFRIVADRLAVTSSAAGSGKSLCFQLPSVIGNQGVTLVISPLVALMHDQVRRRDVRHAFHTVNGLRSTGLTDGRTRHRRCPDQRRH